MEFPLWFSLGNHSKQFCNECHLVSYLSFFHALYLSFSYHVHDLKSLQGSPGCFEGKEAHPEFCQSLDEPMILLNEIVEVFYLPQLDRFWKYSRGFELSNSLGIGRIFIHIDHARDELGSMRRCELSLTAALGLRG